MSKLRVLLVSHDYWPLAGESSYLASKMAQALSQLEHDVCVPSARVVRQWPGHFQDGLVRVVRISLPSRRVWTGSLLAKQQARWAKALQRWLSTRSADFDLIVMLDAESSTVRNVKFIGKRGTPLLVRVDARAIADLTLGSGALEKTPTATWQLVANEERIYGELVGSFGEERVALVGDGVDVGSGVLSERGEVRQSLSKAHQLLHLEPRQILAITVQPLERESGLLNLVRAWQEVVQSLPLAKLWIIGEGPQGSEIFRRICDQRLNDSVVMPGQFESMSLVLRAADLFVMPGSGSEFSPFARLAAALGVPLICHSSAPAQLHIQHRETGVLTGGQPQQLARTIIECCRDLPTAVKLGLAMRTTVTPQVTFDRMANEYVRLGVALKKPGEVLKKPGISETPGRTK